jgi:hypothetical protein
MNQGAIATASLIHRARCGTEAEIMRNKRRLIVITVGSALLAGSVAGAVALGQQSEPEPAGPYGGPNSVHGPRPAPDCQKLNPPCPHVMEPQTLQEVSDHKQAGFHFVPPPEGAHPAIDAYEAADIAWQEGAYSSSTEQPILVLIPAGGNFKIDRLGWLIVYPDACHIFSSIPGTHGKGCVVQPGYTLIDAETGDFIATWTSPNEPLPIDGRP